MRNNILTRFVLLFGLFGFYFANSQETNLKPNKKVPVKLKHSYTFEDGSVKDVVGKAHGTIIGEEHSKGQVIEGLFVNYEGGRWSSFYEEDKKHIIEYYLKLPAEKININKYKAITLEAFVLPAKTDGVGSISFFGKYDQPNNTKTDYIHQFVKKNKSSVTKILCFDESNSQETTISLDGPLLQDVRFHHVVTTFDNHVLKYYIDGVLVASKPITSHKNTIANLSNEDAFLLKSGSSFFEKSLGAIDEFNIYEGVLDSTAIANRARNYLDNRKYPNDGYFKIISSLSNPEDGCRPASKSAEKFLKTYKKSQITLYPTILRTADSTTWSKNSGKTIAESLKNDLDLNVQYDDFKIKPKELRGINQYEIFQYSGASIGKIIENQDMSSDYNIVLEILFAPKKNKRLHVFGIQFYVFTNDGYNAYSFFINQYHDTFKYAGLYEDNPSEESLEALKEKCTWVALEVFKKQLNNKISYWSKPIDYSDYRLRLSPTTLYTTLPMPTEEDFKNGAMKYPYP
ncbi:LamG-like jellyroll fold domain-containing protein [Flavobacteriaceae bacterium SZ-1-7]|uniref:LamG-like jellyroll fold domain-containing protein n=1 Tax=Tamlana sedimenti TaxID=3134126 RepID=UPI0031271D98